MPTIFLKVGSFLKKAKTAKDIKDAANESGALSYFSGMIKVILFIPIILIIVILLFVGTMFTNGSTTSLYAMQSVDPNVDSSGSSGSYSGSLAYIQWALDTAADDTHGYSMDNRTGPDYDCSSFVYYSLLNSGYTEEQIGSPAFATGTEGEMLKKAGFTEIAYDKSQLQVGDILVDPNPGATGHTTIICSNDGGVLQEVAAHSNYDGVTGDSGGNEICVSDFDDSGHNYQYIYRLTS